MADTLDDGAETVDGMLLIGVQSAMTIGSGVFTGDVEYIVIQIDGKFQRIAAVVGVRGRDVAAQHVLGIIQRHRNLMVHGLLEIVRLGNRWFTQKSGC